MPVTPISASVPASSISGAASPRTAQASDLQLFEDAMGTAQTAASPAELADFDKKFREGILQQMIKKGYEDFQKVFSRA